MKYLIYILMLIPMMGILSGCAEDVDVIIPEDIDKADITGITVYDEQLATIALQSVNIDTETKAVVAIFNAAQNLSQVKISLTISSGSTVENALGTGFLDFSSPKTVTIISPGKTVKNVWTVTIVNP